MDGFVRILVGFSLLFAAFDQVYGGLTTTLLQPKTLWNLTYTDKLRHDILLNYDKFSRPSQHYNTTVVNFGLTVRHIDLNELKHTFTVHSYIRLSWNDDKLVWNVSDYGNLEILHLADHEIWQPDIFVYNSATATAINNYGNTHALVYPEGKILWVPPAQLSALCELNLRYWPFDTQECMLKFGSWTYHGDLIDLRLHATVPEDNIELEHLENSTEWKVTGTRVERNVKYYPCCPEPYPDITVYFSLKRVSPSYRALVITPAVAIILLTLAAFLLPPQAGEKIILQGCTAIVICMYMLYFSTKLPAMGTHTPLIVLFYCNTLYVLCFSLIGSVIVIWMSRTQHSYNVPWIIKQQLTGWLGKWLFLSHYNNESKINSHRSAAEEMRDHQVTDLDNEQHSSDERHIISSHRKISYIPMVQNDWILFAAAIDRLSFVFYSLLFVLFAIVYSL